MGQPLYERLGGEAAVSAAVDKFYEKVLNDERINSFFKNIDMPRQIQMQKDFLTKAFGGPDSYAGRGMRMAHASLLRRGLDDGHFDVVIELIGEALSELGVAADLIGEAAEIAESVRDDVLGRQGQKQVANG